MSSTATPACRIRRLPDALANQIAAGEVVERPASVVKELLENAVDAGATRVTVEIEQGGLGRIAVVDDGDGMTAIEATLAFERHATSKLARIEDQEHLGTFGFRGEALPSIASVAKVTLTTRARGQSEAFRVVLHGGHPQPSGPCGAAVGTRVDVADLFYNVPARRKFLKAPATESAHVGAVIADAALCRPGVAFRLLRDGKTARDYLRAASREERVAQVVPGEELRAVFGERGPYRVSAFLSAPERARSGATGLEILVNDRPVRDRALARAVAQGYGSVLEPGRYPVGVLYIDMPPERVDVNVHPPKAEVRFHDARELQGAVVRALNEGLGRVFAVPALGLGPNRANAFGRPADSPSGLDPYAARSLSTALPVRDDPPGVYAPERPTAAAHEPTAPPLDAAELFPRQGAAPLREALFGAPAEGFYGALRYLAQVRATFLVCEGADGLYVLDQHAAAERVLFHRLVTARRRRSTSSQGLLTPALVDVGHALVALFTEAEAEIAALGFDVRPFGERSVAVHAVPALLSRASPEDFVRELGAELGRSATRPLSGRVDLALATLACHGSVRAGDMLDPQEVRALLTALDEVDFSGHCPHGRPVVTRLPFDELERRVGR